MQIDQAKTGLADVAPTNVANLDLLRCTAVLIVVVSHLWFGNYSMAVLGRLGVLFFFVHTALVLMFSLKRLDTGQAFGTLYLQFITRRVFRIYPLAIVVVLLVYVFDIPSFAVQTRVVALIPMDHLGLAMNLMLVQDVVVSAQGSMSQIGQLWTLPIEMRLYLILPIFYLLMRLFPPVKLASLLWLLSVPGAIGAGWLVNHTVGYPIALFDWGWLVFPRLLEFMPVFISGMLAAALWPYRRPMLPFIALPLLLGAATLGYYALTETIDRGKTLTFYGFVACLAIAVLIPFIREPSWAGLRRVAAFGARYSYGVYLVHLSCIWLAFDKLDRWPMPLQWAAFIAALIAASMVLYHLVEQPFINLGKSLASRF